MKSLLVIAVLLLGGSLASATQQRPLVLNEPTKPRPVIITLRTGETLKGDLLKVDAEAVEFTVRKVLQAVSLDEVATISFGARSDMPAPTPTPNLSPSANQNQIEEMGKNGVSRPVVLSRETANYTKEAKEKAIQGTVILSVLFTAESKIESIRTIRGLPYGLSESAIEAARKIKFQPATKDGKPVTVRGNLEFTFRLY